MKAPTIPPCARHGERAWVLSCLECSRWWALAEAKREADFWRNKYREERDARRSLERKLLREAV